MTYLIQILLLHKHGFRPLLREASIVLRLVLTVGLISDNDVVEVMICNKQFRLGAEELRNCQYVVHRCEIFGADEFHNFPLSDLMISFKSFNPLATKLKLSDRNGKAAFIAHCCRVLVVTWSRKEPILFSQAIFFLTIYLTNILIWFTCSKFCLASVNCSYVSQSIAFHLSKWVPPRFTSSLHKYRVDLCFNRENQWDCKLFDVHFGCAAAREIALYRIEAHNLPVLVRTLWRQSLHLPLFLYTINDK